MIYGVVTVRGLKVEVSGETPTEVFFTNGEHGKKEAGRYYFWTAFGEDKYGPWTCIGRARSRLSPGDRFSRMARESKSKKIPKADRAVYRALHKRFATILGIRPSTAREVKRWIDTHTEPPHNDATFIKWPIKVGGRELKRFPAGFV